MVRQCGPHVLCSFRARTRAPNPPFRWEQPRSVARESESTVVAAAPQSGSGVHGDVLETRHTVACMATITAGRRSRPAVPLPVRWLGATLRNTTFVVAGIPVQFTALLALALPWTGPWSRTASWPWFLTIPSGPPIHLWQVTVALVASVVLVLLIRVPLTAGQRHRCWSLLGIDIPRPRDADGILALRPFTSLRAASTWRQLGYHLVAGPALALMAMLTLGAWALGLAFAAAYGYASVFPARSAIQTLTDKEKTLLTVSGCLLLLLAAPALAAMTAWLDRRAAAALLGPSR